MKVQHLAIAVAVLGGIAALTYFLKRDDGPEPTDAREGQPLVATATIEKVAALHVHTPTGDVDVAKSEGPSGKWVVKSYHDLPADFSKIATLIKELRESRIERLASSRAERIATMGFDGTELELRGADGQALVKLHLGKSATGGRYIKFNDETKAYFAKFSAYLDTTAKNWADATLLAAKPEEVVALETAMPDGTTLKFKRENGTAPWTAEGLAEGEKVKESEVSSLLSKLTGLRFTETADPAAEDVTAARANSRTFKVTLATGKSYDVVLGRKPAPPAPPAPPPPETPPAEGATPPAPPPPPPPGPVYVFVTSSDPSDAINAVMQKRGFQIYEWTYTSLPSNRTALIEAAPPAPAPAAAPTPAPAPEAAVPSP